MPPGDSDAEVGDKLSSAILSLANDDCPASQIPTISPLLIHAKRLFDHHNSGGHALLTQPSASGGVVAQPGPTSERLTSGTQQRSPASQGTQQTDGRKSVASSQQPDESGDCGGEAEYNVFDCQDTVAAAAARSRRLRTRPSAKWGKDDSVYLSSPDMSDDTESRRNTKRTGDDVDFETIKDPAKRRLEKQKAKNRRTAAKSRERKKEQQAWLEQENIRLQEEVNQLRNRLEQRTREIEELAQARGVDCDAAHAQPATFLLQLLAGIQR